MIDEVRFLSLISELNKYIQENYPEYNPDQKYSGPYAKELREAIDAVQRATFIDILKIINKYTFTDEED